MKEYLLTKWNSLNKQAKLFICAVVILVIAGLILK
jgi:hypothetical protein